MASPLRVLIAEDQYLMREGTRRLLAEVVRDILAHRSGKRGTPLAELTDAEREVLRLMAEGHSNMSIANRLSVSVGSVEKRIASVFSKLGLPDEATVNRRVAAVLVYLRETMPGR